MVPVTLNDPVVFQSYCFYSGVLAMKMFMVSFLTARTRYRKKVFANPEDAKRMGVVKYDDPDVERVRRAHLNDLENIPVFWVVGALYVTTGPAAAWAQLLFRVYTAGRILHTVVYAVAPMPQPARGIAFGVPMFISMYMATKVIMHYAAAW